MSSWPSPLRSTAHAVRQVRVSRQAIYDPGRRIVSYAVRFEPVGSLPGDGVPGSGEQATSHVIASTFGTFGLTMISNDRPVFINVTRAFLTGVIPIPVDPDFVIVELPDTVVVDHELALGLNQLHEAGYRIALRDFCGEGTQATLLSIADFVAIDVGAVPALLLPGLVAAARDGGATVIATGIGDADTHQRCLELGFDLFQGPHLQRPTVLQGRTLSPSQLTCVRLLAQLADPEAAPSTIEHLVASDPGLTLRLLRTANSAAGAANTTVTSLRQALVLIGPRRLRAWLLLTLLDGAASPNRGDDLWRVLARANACQRLAGQCSDLAFTIGLLSGAADLLGADPATVADGAGVGQEARNALVHGEGPAGRALAAVLAHERDDLAGITRTGLAPEEVSETYLESLSQSLTVVHELTDQVQ